MINILADQYLYNIQSYLPENINLKLFDPAEGLPPELSTAHALLIRTVNSINKQTLPNIPDRLSFIGTGSSGTDHVDIPYLNRQGVAFADAGGCNARSVAEYVATSLLLWAEQRQKSLTELCCGVIGAGNVGRQVIAQLNTLGVTTIVYDPPRENRDANFISASEQETLACDILSFHTPLIATGPHPTRHWLDTKKLAGRSFELVINTSRGGVIAERAVLKAIEVGSVGDIIIDVWEDEPEFYLDTAANAFLKTPHIAGYSIQAKERASKLIADALINHFDLSDPKKKAAQKLYQTSGDAEEFASLSDMLMLLHPVKKYEQKLVEIAHKHPNERGVRFNGLRAKFPLRQEFAHICLPESYFERFSVLQKLGFSLVTADSE